MQSEHSDNLDAAAHTLRLHVRSLSVQFGPAVYQRGTQLAVSGAVGPLEISVTLKPVGVHARFAVHTFELKAVVGSASDARKSYQVRVRFSSGSVFGLTCRCSCVYAVHCKHAAALLQKLLANDLSKPTKQRPASVAILPSDASSSEADERITEAALASAGIIARADDEARKDRDNERAWTQWLRTFDRTPVATEMILPYDVKPVDNVVFVLSLSQALLTVRPTQILVSYRGTSREAKRAQSLPNLLRVSNYLGQDLWEHYPERFRPALQLLYSNATTDMYQNSTYQLIGELGERTLAALFEHDVYLDKFGGQALHLGEARAAELRWQPTDDGTLVLKAAVQPNAAFFVVADVWYFDAAHAEIGRVLGISAEQFKAMQSLPPLRPANMHLASHGFLARPRLSKLPTPLALTKRIVNHQPKPILILERLPLEQSKKDQAAGVIMIGARLVFDYETASFAPSAAHSAQSSELRRVPDQREQSYAITAANELIEVQRWTAFEDDVRAQLRGFSLERLADGQNNHPYFQNIQKTHWLRVMPHRYAFDFDDWYPLIEPIENSGITVEIDPQLPLELIEAPQDWYADLDDSGESGWFNLELGIVINGERTSLLPILVQALASHQLSLQPAVGEAPDAVWLAALDARRRVPLPLAKVRMLIAPIIEWLEGLQGDRLRLPALRAAVLNELSDSEISLRSSQAIRKLANLTSGGALNHKRCAVPKTLKAKLRGYQRDGLDWLSFLGEHGLGGVLADDMGLGKTIQVLAHILAERAAKRLSAPVLIVMPTSLIPNWYQEAKRFAPVLKVLTLHGADRAAKFADIFSHDVVLTTYALLFRDETALLKHHFSLAVFDEAQAIKNPQSKAALTARRIDADRRLVMSGTPMENHLGELWAQIDLVLPGLLGPQRAFTTRFRTPIEKFGDVARSKVLEKRLKPFLLRRTKSEVASDLPAKTEITRLVALEGDQRELYETLRLAMNKKVRTAIAARGIKQSGIVMLDALLKLRQACCDPALVKLPSARKVEGSAKREILQEMLTELIAEGRRVLVFSQFTEMLDLIESDLTKADIGFLRLDGSTRDRQTPVQRFQALEVPVFLISLKAGGVGLNLTAADTVIHYDPWWNPAVENQATDRAHRIGQDKPVFVYKLVCSDTIEEKIVALQAKKAELASAIMSGGSSTELKWDAEAIAHLFGGDE